MENSRFQKRKSETLAAISSQLPDKSPKGSLDTPIIPLITAVNSHPSFFTTSSCSGRISILSHPSSSSSSSTSKKKARGGTWLFVSHDFVDPDDVVPLLFGSESQQDSDSDLVFRFEPLIIAVECADIEAAQLLVSTAVSCGFRESGITNVQKRVIIGIRCSIRMEVPLGQLGKVMVSEEYVRYLVGIANEKLETNRSRTDGLLRVLQDKVLSGPVKHIDSYEMKKGRVSDKGSQLHLEAEQVHLGAHKSTDLFCEGSSEDLNLLNELEVGYNKKEISKQDPNPELSGTPACSISVNTLMIVGEPIEKLFLWGHSACTLNSKKTKEIIIFGGFGGLGRHARRNYSLMLDLQLGKLNEIDACGSPSPRLGHTSSVVGDKFFVIGGREGPTQILNDVWVLQLSENRWQLLECTGSIFHPRHRHAAVAVGSNIYVFGGLNGEVIYSSMHILNTDTSQWTEVSTQGEWPSPRHSNSLVAYGSLLFMFGGYNGEKAIGDLYCFDIKTCLWEKVNTSGRAPSPRFSHCMFIYKHYLGIVGGCPIRKQNQELSLLNLEHNIWVHVKVDSVDRDLWVRSSTIVIDDRLVIIGGGTSCYAFGTKFNKPIKINLEPIDSLHGVASDKENKPPTELVDAKYYVLQVEKKYAKLAKDVLKKFGWLDLTRKVQPRQDDCNIQFPVVKSFYSLFQKELLSVDTTDDFYLQDIFAKKGLALNEVSIPVALRFLVSCGSSLQISDASYVKKASKTPQNLLNESVCSLLREKELPPKLLDQLPLRWERLGDIVVLPVNSFKDPIWDSIGNELWPIVAKSLGAQRLARQGRILPTGTRDSTLEILVGDGGWVTHQENGILYSLDATKCMFSSGNHSEKLRMAHLNCTDEVVVDLFAGIGYFVLPFLVKAKAKLVYACEWNPQAIEALQHNIKANFVAERCTILEGDNRVTAPKGVANRVCLGLLPSSEGSWATAVRALRVEGGVLHIHENVKDSEEKSWLEHVLQSIGSIAQSEGLHWDVSIQHVERVKWYGPHIRHIVADVKCQQLET